MNVNVAVFLILHAVAIVGRDSAVGISTHYGLDHPGIPIGGQFFLCLSGLALGPTHPPIQWVSGVSRG